MQIDIITRTEFELLVNKIDSLTSIITTEKKQTTELLEVSEAAKKLRVSEKTLRNYIDCGNLPAINLNKGTPLRPIYKIEASELDKYIKARRTR
jgi:excisionase family DNA binding protein